MRVAAAAPKGAVVCDPKPDTVRTAQADASVLKDASFAEYSAILVEEFVPLLPGGRNGETVCGLTKGYYLKVAEDDAWEYYRPAPGPEGGNLVNFRGRPFQSDQPIRLDKRKNTVSVMLVMHATRFIWPRLWSGTPFWSDPVTFRRVRGQFLVPGSVERELVYQGRTGSRVRFHYCEVQDNEIVPSASDYPTLDLTGSPVLEYKGARLEIIEATDQTVTYRVLKAFDPT